MFRIINDELETGLKDIKNAMTSLYPKLKYSDETIEEIKNMDLKENIVKKEETEEKKNAADENNIKEEEEEGKEIKEKEEKSNESDKEKK